MDYSLIIRTEARAELLDTFQWYQMQRTNLGLDFKHCIDEVFTKIQKNPLVCPVVFENVRRAITKRFPFGVFYIIEDKTVIILAVLHARRDPMHWKKRV